jgi:hypothetical protein
MKERKKEERMALTRVRTRQSQSEKRAVLFANHGQSQHLPHIAHPFLCL